MVEADSAPRSGFSADGRPALTVATGSTIAKFGQGQTKPKRADTNWAAEEAISRDWEAHPLLSRDDGS
jgi:hypothetical protein